MGLLHTPAYEDQTLAAAKVVCQDQTRSSQPKSWYSLEAPPHTEALLAVDGCWEGTITFYSFPCSSWMTCASGVSGLFKERKKRIRLGGMREVGEMSRYFFGYIYGILQNKGKFTSKV